MVLLCDVAAEHAFDQIPLFVCADALPTLHLKGVLCQKPVPMCLLMTLQSEAQDDAQSSKP